MLTRLALAFAIALALPAIAAAQDAVPITPDVIVAASGPDEWVPIAPEDLLVMDLAPDARGRARRVVIQLLPPPFSQPWVANIRTLARAHWWDGTSVYRVVDNWVAQWGAGGDADAGFALRQLPEGMVAPTSGYEAHIESGIRVNYCLEYPCPEFRELPGWTGLPYPQSQVGSPIFYLGWPLALENRHGEPFHALGQEGEDLEMREVFPVAWPIHCYAHVGVARNLAPDTGTGAELYAVIGHAPRQLDRNIAVVGRVIEGIAYLSTLPRGTGAAGVYEDRAEDTPILSVRLGNELSDPPQFEYLSTDSESFARYVALRANRDDAFYTVPAGGVDICNVQVPIRRVAE